MNKVSLFLLTLAALGGAAGCGKSVDNAPPAAATAPRNDPPTKVPTTTEEKIAAIEKAPMPADQKKQAIERVRSGQL